MLIAADSASLIDLARYPILDPDGATMREILAWARVQFQLRDTGACEVPGFLTAGGLWTSDVARAHRVAAQLDAGMVFVNRYGCYDFASPFGGVKQSGWGREMAVHSPLLNVHDLAVVPTQRGRGIGSALLDAAASRAREAGCCKLTLEVQDDNDRARAVYTRFGFTDFVLGDDAVPTRFLSKSLGDGSGG